MTLRHAETGAAHAIWLLTETVDLRERKLAPELTGDSPLPGYAGWTIEGYADVAYPIEELEAALAQRCRAGRVDRKRFPSTTVHRPPSSALPNKKRRMIHNKRTRETALACAAIGLSVVDVHSIDDDGKCTCQYGNDKADSGGSHANGGLR